MSGKMKKMKWILILVSLIGTGICIKAEKGMLEKNMLCVNEVCTKNLSIISMDGEKYPDGYIELYNAGEEPIHLKEYFISNRAEQDTGIALPDKVIQPKDYLLLYMEDNGINTEDNIVLDMEMKGDRQGIYLMNKRGKVVSSLEFPELQVNMAFGRTEDGGSAEAAQNCTPDLSNHGALEVELPVLKETPDFSAESGFYENEFYLTLSADKRYAIYYTLDGSIPTRESRLYKEPIYVTDASKNGNVLSARTDLSIMEYDIPKERIDKATVIRAVLYDEKGEKSRTVTKTYFVGEDMLEKYHQDIPVMSIVAEPSGLIGYEKGIFVLGKVFDDYINLKNGETEGKRDFNIEANFSSKGKEWEREATAEYFQDNQSVQQTIGIRTRGKSSSQGPQKCLNLYARKAYDGNSFFTFDFLQTGVDSKRYMLKPGMVLLRDCFVSSMLYDRNMKLAHFAPLHLFINGEYWGFYTLMEKYDELFFENYFGVDADKVIILKNKKSSRDSKLDYDGDFQKIIQFTQVNDLSVPENYEWICEKIDIESFIDYYCTQIYIDNTDCTETYNMLVWKTSETDGNNAYADGKWRWLLYDIDAILNQADRDNISQEIRENRAAFFSHDILGGLLRNDEFRLRFINTFMDLMNFNFNGDVISKEYEKQAEKWKTCFFLQEKRFSHRAVDIEADINDKNYFWKHRKDYIVRYMQDYFGLGDLQNICLEMSEGIESIRVNSSEVRNNGKEIKMQYFPGIPISLEAKLEEGYELSGWQSNGEMIGRESMLEITPGGEMHLKVSCEKED